MGELGQESLKGANQTCIFKEQARQEKMEAW